MEVDFEFEVGPSKEGVQLSIKSRMGRVLKVTSIEMTEREALRLAEVLTRSAVSYTHLTLPTKRIV